MLGTCWSVAASVLSREGEMNDQEEYSDKPRPNRKRNPSDPVTYVRGPVPNCLTKRKPAVVWIVSRAAGKEGRHLWSGKAGESMGAKLRSLNSLLRQRKGSPHY